MVRIDALSERFVPAALITYAWDTHEMCPHLIYKSLFGIQILVPEIQAKKSDA